MERLHKYASCSESCYILGFIYLDRLLQRNPAFVLSMKNIHRLVLISTVLAIKYLDDAYADNNSYAIIGGITLKEFNLLEVNMLRLLRYDLYIDPLLFAQYLAELQFHYQRTEEEAMSDVEEEGVKPTEDCESVMSGKTNVSMVDSW
eukprot:TRINITY_DN855_c0_g1_i1.p1 TRINITY_DN855_c0_g1~~TRINITY_DN855_c0_g1_i1.p1  ORF type:complete len:147 (+),score=37.42 TRINITY_DN855_c0_g1_i1:53-493(+)